MSKIGPSKKLENHPILKIGHHFGNFRSIFDFFGNFPHYSSSVISFDSMNRPPEGAFIDFQHRSKPGPKKTSRGPNTCCPKLERTSKEPSVRKLSFEVLEVKLSDSALGQIAQNVKFTFLPISQLFVDILVKCQNIK